MSFKSIIKIKLIDCLSRCCLAGGWGGTWPDCLVLSNFYWNVYWLKMFVSSFCQTFVEKFADQTFSAVEKTFKNICVRCSHLSLKISSTISSYQFTLYRQGISRQKLEMKKSKIQISHPQIHLHWFLQRNLGKTVECSNWLALPDRPGISRYMPHQIWLEHFQD